MNKFITIIVLLFAFQLHANQQKLILAIKSSDHEVVDQLLRAGEDVNINEEDAFGRTPLFFASDEQMVHLLYQHGAIEQVDILGMNPLHYLRAVTGPNRLARAESEDEVREQIDRAATAFVRASNNIDRMEYQLDRDGRFPDEYTGVEQPGAIPLIFAVIRNDLPLVRRMLAEGADVNEVDHLGRRAIFFVRGEEMLYTLIWHGAILAEGVGQPDFQTDIFGQNPLHTLFAVTAPNLLARAIDEGDARQQIEATAFLLMRTQIQENGSGVLRSRNRLEKQRDLQGLRPATFLHGPLWRHEFLVRARFDHVQIVRPSGPLTSFKASIR